jgi:hypothetical protein
VGIFVLKFESSMVLTFSQFCLTSVGSYVPGPGFEASVDELSRNRFDGEKNACL